MSRHSSKPFHRFPHLTTPPKHLCELNIALSHSHFIDEEAKFREVTCPRAQVLADDEKYVVEVVNSRV